MFIALLWKEIRNHLLTFRFAAALLTTLLLVIVSMWILAGDYSGRLDAYNLAAETAERQNRDVYVPSQISPTLHRPPAKLSIFAQGEDRRFGNTIRVRRWNVPRAAEESFTDNMLMAATQSLDLYTFFSVVASLFAILFSFDAVCGERENGTLKLQSAAGAGRASIFTAKFLGCAVCLTIPILIGIAAGLLVLSLSNIGFSPEHWLAIALMVLAGLLSCAIFIAVGLTCSALVRRSSVSLVLSLLLWTLSVLVLPNAAQSAADAVAPLPSPAEVSSFENASEKQAVERAREFRDEHPRYAGGNWTGGWTLPGDGAYYKYDADEEAHRLAEDFVRFIEPLMLDRSDRVWSVFNSQTEARSRQLRIVDAISFVSPAWQLRKALTSLASTDFSTYNDFLQRVRRYREQMIEGFRQRGYFSHNALAFFTRRPRSDVDDEKYAKRSQYYRDQFSRGRAYRDFMSIYVWDPLPPDQIPPFEFRSDQPDFAGALFPAAVLAFALLLVFALGLTAFSRYDVR